MMIVPGKQIALNRVGDSEISTVELPRFPGEDQIVYETCIFSGNGTSNVVARYENAGEAHRAHNAIVQHELAHFMAKEMYQS